jgi:hypothetical protein
VLFIGGWGRSGSTLLVRLLGETPGVVAVGELRLLALRGLSENPLCGCGARFRDCPFWTEVGDEAYGGWDAAPAEDLAALDRAVVRVRTLPGLLAPALVPSFRSRLRAYLEQMERIYGAIAKVSGASLVIDSGKAPHYALALRHARALELSVAHLVRDSRAVAYSWQRHKSLMDRERYMDVHSPARSGYRWLLYNALVDLAAGSGVPRRLVRYESLAAAPREELEGLLAFAGRPAAPGDLDFLNGSAASVGVHHLMYGNPDRFVQGKVEIRPDLEWQASMRSFDRVLVSALTLPLLVRYGYVGPRKASRLSVGPRDAGGSSRSAGGSKPKP